MKFVIEGSDKEYFICNWTLLITNYNAVQTLLITLEKMSYHIRTMMGNKESYSNLQNWVIGTLKGSGASPALWLGITCILLGAISKTSRGICFCNPKNTCSMSRVAETYVDDTELMIAVDQGDISDFAAEMQIIVQHWEQLLYTTGGAFALEKCFYVAFDWNFVNDKYVLKTKDDLMGLNIAFYSGQNVRDYTLIPQKDPCNGPRNLGAQLAPSGNNIDKMSHLIQEGRTLRQNISASRLSRHKVMLAYKTMLRPAMKSPLCGTTFTAHECEIIDRSYFRTLLSRMGFNPMTIRLLFFGPPSLGWFGFTNTYTDQGISQVQMLLSHLRHQGEIGHMIQIMIENAQLAIGLSLRPLM